MNERIYQLAEQARKYAHDYVAECKQYSHYMEHNEYELRFEEKFALLIVRECVNEIHVADVGDLKGKGYYLDKVAEHIEKHFGVE
jgi:hypothetical protein